MNDFDKFAPLLAKGETVEWTGRPAPFLVVDRYNKKSLYLRWVLITVAAIVCVAAYIIYTSSKEEAKFQIIVPILFIAAAVFFILRPIADARTIQKKRLYAITSQRNLICDGEESVKEMNLDDIHDVKLIHKGNGVGDVIFGKAAFRQSYNTRRVTAIVPLKNVDEGPERITAMVFYNIKGYEQIRPLLAAGTGITEETLA